MKQQKNLSASSVLQLQTGLESEERVNNKLNCVTSAEEDRWKYLFI